MKFKFFVYVNIFHKILNQHLHYIIVK